MKPHLILLDLDDTFLNTSKAVSPMNANAVRRCGEAGIRIGYITAKPAAKARLCVNGLPCDCLAGYNGASIYADGVLIEKNEIALKTAVQIMRSIQATIPDAEISAYLEPYKYARGKISDITNGTEFPCGLDDLPELNVQRIRVRHGPGGLDAVKSILPDNVRCVISANGAAIITSLKATKEHALKRLAAYFKIPFADIIAFGDDVNDIGMIKLAGIGIAMGNAADSVKKSADAIIGSNDSDGVANWINKNLF